MESSKFIWVVLGIYLVLGSEYVAGRHIKDKKEDVKKPESFCDDGSLGGVGIGGLGGGMGGSEGGTGGAGEGGGSGEGGGMRSGGGGGGGGGYGGTGGGIGHGFMSGMGGYGGIGGGFYKGIEGGIGGMGGGLGVIGGVAGTLKHVEANQP